MSVNRLTEGCGNETGQSESRKIDTSTTITKNLLSKKHRNCKNRRQKQVADSSPGTQQKAVCGRLGETRNHGGGDPAPPLQSLDERNHVTYLDSVKVSRQCGSSARVAELGSHPSLRAGCCSEVVLRKLEWHSQRFVLQIAH